MKSHARVVVIGGGVVGCSVLYHLAKFGWTDAVLLERSELTSGSTWHAAGGMHTINGDTNVARLQKYTIELYKEIEELSGQATGVHITGGILLAATQDRFDWLKGVVAQGRYLGLEMQLMTPEEAQIDMPLMDPSKFVGAVRTHTDGHLDPSGVTYAYAKSARKLGAEIETHTMVKELHQQPDGGWLVVTDKGNITCEHVVNAAGLWAREVGRMAGLELPLLAMEHMYLLTEDMPEVAEANAATGHEIIHAVDFDGELYLRQERGGMLMGTYEKACVPWSVKETPWDFGHELLAPDIDRIAPSLEVGFEHFPAFQNAGIKQIINGPFTFAPDGNPLVGPIPGMGGMWMANAVMAGFSQGGGVGLALANWMINGDPGYDIFGMDVARYGNWASMAYTNAKVQENYSRRFSIKFPNEELPAARPLRTTPIYDLLAADGAQFGVSWGLEVPLWFAPDGVRDEFGWRRANDFEHVAAEVVAVRNKVGLFDTSGYAKYAVKGQGAEAWLDHLLACRMPATGRMKLAPMLKQDGRVIGDFTLAKLDRDDFFIVGSGVAQDYHMRWFLEHLPDDGSVTVEPYGQTLAGISIAGPNARDLLAQVTDADVSAEVFKFMDIRRMDVAMAKAIVGRVSFTGDLGYELWMAPEFQRHIYLALHAAGQDLGLRNFGLRALNALRLEKSFGSWGTEFRPIYTADECGLNPFVALKKDAEFIGKSCATKNAKAGGKLRLCTFILDTKDCDVIGNEPIYHDNNVVGWVTSGGYAHNANSSVALGYVPRELADKETGWAVEILGTVYSAKQQFQPLFDANGAAMRG